MMVDLVSDLHLEFGDLELPGGEILLVAGDTSEVKSIRKELYEDGAQVVTQSQRKERRVSRFLQEECSEKYDRTLMVMGNHEHYGHLYQKTYNRIASQLPHNVTLLENEAVTIGDVIFIGATLWTDMNNGDPLTLYHVKSKMNDYRQITMHNEAKNMYHRLLPEFTVKMHDKSKAYIKHVVENDPKGKFVVMTHHAPSRKSIKPHYMTDTLMNGAYNSDLSEFIMDHPQIKVWVHGHTHEFFDYKLGETRVICNPRGYVGYEASAMEYSPANFEV